MSDAARNRPEGDKVWTMPQVRDAMFKLADRLAPAEADELRYIAGQTWRRPLARKPGRRRYPVPSDAQAEAIRTYAETHPDVGTEAIARIFGTAGGRVSEVLRGKRGE